MAYLNVWVWELGDHFITITVVARKEEIGISRFLECV